MPKKNGCTNAAVRPSSKPNSPPFANASCAVNTIGDDAMVAKSAVRPTSSEDDEAMMTLAFFSSVFFAGPLLHRAKDDGDGLLEDEDEEDDPEVERRETICWAWLVALNITDSLSRVCVCLFTRG
jgi:hypothetical protein